MEGLRKRLIHLHSCRHMNWKRIHKLLELDRSLHDVYRYPKALIKERLDLSEKRLDEMYDDLHRFDPDDVLSYYETEKITPITIFDDAYPKLLKEIYDPPFVLYAKGNLSLLQNKKRLAVVGTRQPTPYGVKALAAIVPPLVDDGWVIVSGLAKGIDTYAHRAALQHRGKTIAVLGSGFHHPYPKENETLMQTMAHDQLLLTEYPPYVPPRKWHFPIRNRIISGLSQAVLVVEAKEKSGSLITADQALEQGRDVFAIPGSIFQAQSTGTNRLIQQGAKLVLSAEDIINECHLFF